MEVQEDNIENANPQAVVHHRLFLGIFMIISPIFYRLGENTQGKPAIYFMIQNYSKSLNIKLMNKVTLSKIRRLLDL